MPEEESNFGPMTIDELYERKRLAKEERSRRLAQLSFEKKIEIVKKFNGIVDDALREDDERRAAEQRSPDEN